MTEITFSFCLEPWLAGFVWQGSTNICLIYLAFTIRERGNTAVHDSQRTGTRNHFVFEWNVAEGFRTKSCFWCGWKTFSTPFLSLDLWLQLSLSLFFFFFSGPEAFSAACPILLLTFETSVRLSWLKKTSPFKSVMGANQNPATPLCVIALFLRGRALILKLQAPQCNISCSCRQFQTQKPLPNKYALPSDA